MDKLKLMVLFGGMSEEHPVSIKSARAFAKHLDPKKYEPIYVFIGRDGAWRRVETPEGDLTRGATATLSVDRARRGLVMNEDGRIKTLDVDVAFPLLHGRYGEDGAVQGLLELSGIPYAGCGIAASALAMDKSLTYRIAASAGVRVPRHRVYEGEGKTGAGDLRYPVFVKPARSGSSFGVSKVRGEEALVSAVLEARRFDDKVLVEEAVLGCEVGCAVLGSGKDLFTGEPDQIELSGGFFRIHQEARPEQGSENATIRVPAAIPEEARDRAKETAKTVYRALGCRGLARVDMFLTPDGEVVLNEVNTMPGLTSYSRYPRMMEAAGVTMREVIDRLIELALLEGGARA
jgi:D-alanine--(R)-lactate ligase